MTPKPAAGTSRTQWHGPVEDIEQVPAFCDRCDEDRVFNKVQRDVAPEELASESPDVGAALTGETVYECEVCGFARRDPVEELGYDYELSNVGYRKQGFVDSEETTRERESGGVRRLDEAGLEQGLE